MRHGRVETASDLEFSLAPRGTTKDILQPNLAAGAVKLRNQRLEPLFSKDLNVMTDFAFIWDIRACETPTT